MSGTVPDADAKSAYKSGVISSLLDALIRALTRLVFGMRAAVLDRPFLRALLRALGRPAILLVHLVVGRSGLPPETPPPQSEPVLRLPLAYRPAPAPAFRIAVVLHAYYLDVLPEISRRLRHLPRADLYVSTDTPEKKRAIEAQFAGWDLGSVEVRLSANRGRNAAPQFAGFRDVYGRYDLALLIHGKKSLHDPDLASWRDGLLDDLIGSPEVVEGVLEVFARQPRIGLLAPRNLDPIRKHMVWGGNFARCRDLAERLGFPLYPDSPLDFPAGMMFWARPAALRPLLDLGLTTDDFEPEAGQTNDTLAHALERLVFHACEVAGLAWARVGEGAEPSEKVYVLTALRPRMHGELVTKLGRSLVAAGRRPVPSLEPAPDKDDRKALYRAELAGFLAEGRRIALKTSNRPKVSVLLVLFNQAELTLQCFKSLAFALEGDCEVIVVDNASSDASQALMGRIDGVRYVRNEENLHFLRAANQAAALARGRQLLFLNNDTRLEPGAIAAAVERLEAEVDLGAVGGRIDLIDGALQEAGDIIWSDASCAGYGRGADPWAPEFQFRRDVDYVSGAFLMTPRALFEDMGGFDLAFAPAYYEETDYCARLWARGMRVGYDPRIRLTHFEFGSSSSSAAALALQAAHREVFATRHAAELAQQPAPGSPPLKARMRGPVRGRVLILDDMVPTPELGAGAPRAIDIVRAVAGAGWFVTHYPLVEDGCDWAAAYRALPPGVEIAAERGQGGLVQFMRERAGYYDAVIVSRPHNMAAFRRALRRVPGFIGLSKVVYDAEAVFALRDAGAKADSGAVKREVALAQGAGGVLVVSQGEAALFRRAGAGPIEIVGHAHRAHPTPRGFDQRQGLLFVGALDDEGPNTDSLGFFVREVMPNLDALIGADWTLKVAGRNSAASVQALAGSRVELLGPVPDLTPLYDAARVFIAPTRFAAGIPMKVHEAAARGVPTAVTPLLAGQLGWGEDAVAIGEGAAGFARAVASLYGDAACWAATRERALVKLAEDCDPVAFAARIETALKRAATSG
jgi:GT2 family glycosyltransferase